MSRSSLINYHGTNACCKYSLLKVGGLAYADVVINLMDGTLMSVWLLCDSLFHSTLLDATSFISLNIGFHLQNPC